jgi:hypothetical protein
MALYSIPSATYVKLPGQEPKHLGAGATIGSPATIEVPDNYPPSVTWAPLDDAAQEALIKHGEDKIPSAIPIDVDPVKDKAKYDRLVADHRKKYKKEIPAAPKPKPEVKEVNTNTEITEGTKKVVGRNADKSPI